MNELKKKVERELKRIRKDEERYSDPYYYKDQLVMFGERRSLCKVLDWISK